jgi:site-specific DNA recombinase
MMRTALKAGVYGRQSVNKSKSIKEQLAAGTQAARDHGWEHAASYKDGVSASRYTTKVRSDWEKVLADIGDGTIDVLVLWESSRGDRNLLSWVGFLELCRERGVLIHVVVEDYTYDLTKPRDMKALAEAGVASAFESDMLSVRLQRGFAGAASEGRPHGGTTLYGYRRTYSPVTGKPESLTVVPECAAVVREIFDRLYRGHPVVTVARDLNARSVPGPMGGTWSRRAVCRIAMNDAYVGIRDHKGTKYQATWEPLVDEEIFYSVQQTLNDPDRKTTRPGRQIHLCSYLVHCDRCGTPLSRLTSTRYACSRGCNSTKVQTLDLVVTEVMIGRLSAPDAAKRLLPDDEAESVDLRGQMARLQAQLDEWRLSAARGQTSPSSLAVIESELTAQIADLGRQVPESRVPPALRMLLEPGVDVRQRWAGMPVAAHRSVIKSLCDITISQGAVGLKGAAHRRATLWRLAGSRWRGDVRTWGELWLEAGVPLGGR